MSRFSDRLKLSVSAAALMGGSLVAASSARAVTITGTQTSASVTNLSEDALIAGTGIISPGGLFVQNHVGNLVNNGLIEGIAAQTDTDTLSLDIDVVALGVNVNGNFTGDVVNNGTIAADASANGSLIGTAGGGGGATLDADARALDFSSTVTGDIVNPGTISADASADLLAEQGTTVDPIASVALVDRIDVDTTAVEIRTLNGSFSNSSSNTVSASGVGSSDHSVIAESGSVDVNLQVFNDVRAYGVDVTSGGDYSFANSGSIDASSSKNSSFAVEAMATSGAADVDVNLNSGYGQAYPVDLDGSAVSGFTNSGTITGNGVADVDVDIDAAGATGADVDLALDAWGYVSAVWVQDIDGDFINSGTISANTTSTLGVDATASSDGGNVDLAVDTISGGGVYGGSYAVDIGNLSGVPGEGDTIVGGSFVNTETGVIEANSTGEAAYNLLAEGYSPRVNFAEPSAYRSAWAVLLNGGEHDVQNSGTIAANTSSIQTIDAAAVATMGNATVDFSASGYGSAYGVYSRNSTGFENSGTITASGAASIDAMLNASAGPDAGNAIVDINDGNLTVSAYAVYIRTLEGDFDNSGTIAATGTTDRTVTASAISETGVADIDVDEDGYIYATGVTIPSFTGTDETEDPAGTLTNSSDLTISAEAISNNTYNLVAAGTSASIYFNDIDQEVYARGIEIGGGTYNIDNSGTVSASATANTTISASANANDSYGYLGIDDLEITVLAYGIDGDGTSTSFVNSGTVTATGAATLSQTLSAIGETWAYLSIDNSVAVSVAGVRLVNTLDGNFANNGSISADGSLAYTGNITSIQSAGPDEVDIDNDFDVTVAGVAVDFVAGSTEMGAPIMRSFTNEGDLTASGTLTVAQTVVAGAQDVPTDTMAAPSDTPEISTDANLTVIAGKLTGGLGTVTNSGTVAASGTVDSADAESMVVGLYLPDAEDGFVLTNSGDVSASLDGTTGTALVAAIKIGSEDTQQPAAETGEPEDPGLITINNSGTISASNTTGVGNAYGIDIMNAPEPVTINQSGGSIAGQTAIAMDQGTDDILNWTGGTIHGLVDADAGDVANVYGGGLVMAPTDFAIDGVGVFNVGLPGVTPTTTPLPPVTTFMMLGSMSNTGTLNVNPLGNLYVGVPAAINVDEFNMNGDATYLTIDVQPGAMGSLSANGDANIDGTLVAAPKPGLYLDTETHTIITADADGSNAPAPTTGSTGSTTGTGTAQTAQTLDGVNGTFDGLMGDTLLLEFSSTINPTSVDLTYNRVPFDAVDGLSGNALSVAEGLEAGYDPTRVAGTGDPELNDVLSYLFVSNDADAYRDMLFSWAGSEHAQMIGAAVNLADPYFMAVSEHLNDTRFSDNQDMVVVNIRNGVGTTLTDPQASAGQSGSDKKASFWGRAFGRWSDQDGDINASGYDNDTYGVVIGLDYLVTDNVKIGIAAAYTDSDIDFDNGAEGEIERFTIGGYLSATVEQFYIDASFSYADDDYEVSRWGIYGGAACPTFDCVMSGINSDYNGDAFLVHGEIGYVFQPGNTGGGVVIQPFLGLNYSDVDIDGFTETGFGDLSLDVADGGGKSTQLRLGTRISTNWDTNSSTKVRPELRLEWRHEFENDPHSFDANLVGSPGIGFTTIGSEIADDLFVIGAGATAEFENGIGAFFEYQGAFGSGYDAHSLQLGARVKF